MKTGDIKLVSLDDRNTIIILNQLEMFAVTDMLYAAAEQTNGRLSHDLIGFADAISAPMKRAVNDAMIAIVGKYEEPKEFIVFAGQDGIDPVMDRIFRGGDEKADEENRPENPSKTNRRKVLPDDN